MRGLWIGTGWKMNKVLAEAEAYVRDLRDHLEKKNTGVRVFIVPPFTVLSRVCELVKGSPVMVGAQNMHWEEKGSFTGEISPTMIKDCGVHLVELGHSERRAQFGETDFSVNKKVLAALRHGLKALICVGETALEREFGVAKESVIRQVKIALSGMPDSKIGDIILAYEPVWAIGDRGTPAEPEYANAVHILIREAVLDLFGGKADQQVPVLYGGSVNIENAHAFIKQPDVDGLFVGRAAWDVNGFIQLIQIVEKEM